LEYIELKNITKTFVNVQALSDVSMSVREGEVHAVVGENGAGKSTIMKILGGMYFADSGEIWIDGIKRDIKNVQDALECGISVVYQELNLMPDLTIAENIYLHNLPQKGGIVDKKTMNLNAQTLLDSMDLKLKSTELTSMLSVSEQQMVEIAKALSHDSDIIIMDEPTASLNNNEVDTLYRLIKNLKKRGKTVIYISHRLQEIFDLSDQVTILRDGTYIGSYKTNEITTDKLVELMVGREISRFYKTADHVPGEIVLEVKNISKEGLYSDVSFSLRKGEILGFAGLMGCNREEIVKTIYGLVQADSGEILLNGVRTMPRNPAEAIRSHIGFVTEDRKGSGVFALMSVRENISMNILKLISEFGLIKADKEQDLLKNYTNKMNMRYSGYYQRINNLSGGNQQKFLLARALAADCKVLIMLEPTRGIDVGAKVEIYSLLGDLAKQGVAIIMVSSELPEIIGNCHRTLVVFQGKITGDISKKDMDADIDVHGANRREQLRVSSQKYENIIMQCATGNITYFRGEDK